MEKIIYSYELDSICNSNKEMTYALDKVFYEEIALNGNKIVLTLNQLADSPFIMSFLNDNFMKDILIGLFNKNKIVVSKFKNKDGVMSSVARYVIHQIENKNFIFSSINCLNIKNTEQKQLILNLLREALIYCDINHFVKELTKYKNCRILPITEKDINLLKNYTEFLIQISLSNTEYLPCKEEKIYKLTECIDIAISALRQTDTNMSKRLTEIKNYLFNNHPNSVQKRSTWIRYNNDNPTNITRKIETVINVCYNMTLESSIAHIDSIVNAENKETYFLERYNNTINLYTCNNHKYFSEKAEDLLYTFSKRQELYWSSIIRIIEYRELKTNNNLSWKDTIKQSRLKLLYKHILSLISILLALYISGSLVDMALNQINSYIKLSSVFIGLIAIILGDIIGYKLDIENFAQTFMDKNKRIDIANCNNIVRHKYYNKELQ